MSDRDFIDDIRDWWSDAHEFRKVRDRVMELICTFAAGLAFGIAIGSR